ncbi:MAG: response regulator transcription factor [Chloroflexota bacterium]
MARRESHKRRASILCVEEDAYLADLLHYILIREGYRVRIAASRADALRLLRKEPCDLVLLDVYLPSVSGYMLCSRRHAEVGVREFIHMAGYSVAGFEHEGNDFFPKPFCLRTLLARIHGTLDATRPVRQPHGAGVRLLRPRGDLVDAT